MYFFLVKYRRKFAEHLVLKNNATFMFSHLFIECLFLLCPNKDFNFSGLF